MIVLKGNRQRVELVRFSPDGRTVVAPSYNGIRVWNDVASTWDAGKMRAIAFSPDGTLAAAGTENGRVVVCDVGV
jgi:WD40 repeat protein